MPSKLPFPVPDEQSLIVLRQFRIIYGAMKQHFRRIEAECGLSGSQVWILQEIKLCPGCGVGHLARRLSVQQSTVSLLVDKLVSKQMLHKTRQKHDQRCVGLWLTEGGETLLRTLPGPADGVLPQALRKLPEDVLSGLESHLACLIENMDTASSLMGNVPLADLVSN